MFNIPAAMQTAYQRRRLGKASVQQHRGLVIHSEALDQPHTWTGLIRQPYGVRTLRRTM